MVVEQKHKLILFIVSTCQSTLSTIFGIIDGLIRFVLNLSLNYLPLVFEDKSL